MPVSPVKIIDPHLHLFDLNLGDYGWLKPQNPPYWPDKQQIARHFHEEDLLLTKEMSLAGFVHIEAGFDNHQPWREIDWLESVCHLPFKTIACTDLIAADFANNLNEMLRRPSVIGLRHILDDDAVSILTHPSTTQHFGLLNDLRFNFEAQLSLTNTPAVDKLVSLAQHHKNMAIMINHGGWPPHKSSNQFNTWQDNLRRLSICPNIAVKLSAWEMTDRNWVLTSVIETLGIALDCFGSNRVMLASNFPLCTLSQSYAQLWQTYHQGLDLSAELFTQLSYTNARRWYKFS
jgi:predicted TIM-barrel fold metal-dependent hydrolase